MGGGGDARSLKGGAKGEGEIPRDLAPGGARSPGIWPGGARSRGGEIPGTPDWMKILRACNPNI